MLGSLATARSTQQCAIAFAETDFRKDIAAIDVPALIIHGDDERYLYKQAANVPQNLSATAAILYTRMHRMDYFIQKRNA